MISDLDRELRGLDPAGPPTPVLSDRAREDLVRIMSTPRPVDVRGPRPAGDGEGRPGSARAPRTGRSRPSSPWLRPSRLAPVAAVTVGLVVVGSSLGGQGDSAYATWTARPAGVSVDDREAAGRACADMWTQGVPENEGVSMEPVLAERRGDWTYTVMRTSTGAFADCLLEDGPWFLGGFSGSGGGGMGDIPSEHPADGDVDVLSYGATGSDGVGFGSVHGRVGPDVASIVVHVAGAGDVQATVADGVWAAWWPVAWEDDDEGPELSGLTITVTRDDGSTADLDIDDLDAFLVHGSSGS